MVFGDSAMSELSEGRRFYVDVHRLAGRNRSGNIEKFHVYSADGIDFGKARRITEVPVRAGDELFVDVIPVELTDDFLELLRRGVKVFRLTRLDLLPQRREDDKTAVNDIQAMMKIEEIFYKVDSNILKLRKLMQLYRQTSKMLKFAKQAMADSGDHEHFRAIVNALRRHKNAFAKEIIKLAENSVPGYITAVDAPKLSKNSLCGKVALAEILTHVDFRRSLKAILAYIGLSAVRKSGNIRLLESAISLTASVKKTRGKVRAKDIRETIKTIRTVLAGGRA